jgi:hypothetical protein
MSEDAAFEVFIKFLHNMFWEEAAARFDLGCECFVVLAHYLVEHSEFGASAFVMGAMVMMGSMVRVLSLMGARECPKFR